MKIRPKIISLLGLLFAVLIALEIAIQEQVVMPSFAALERDAAMTSMKRIDYALGMSEGNLEVTAADWGNWADVYEFVQSHDQDFITANITLVALKQLQINALFIIDLQGRVVVSTARDLESGAPLDLGWMTDGVLPADFPWRRNLTAGPAAQGLIRTRQGIMMIASAPVRDGSGSGRSRGMVIVGKLLTPQEVYRLGAQAQTLLSMMPGGPPRDAGRIVETDMVTEVFRSFPDVYGRTVLTFRVDVPRVITSRGHTAVTYASIYLFGAGVVALMVLLIVLNRIVLSPLARVTRHAVNIGQREDLTARLDLTGHDEVAVLGRELDRMMARLAESRRELVDHSFRSGFAELAKGVLHNLGNAMTPLGVRLNSLSQRLRAAPIADLKMAMNELEQVTAGTVREADLKQFIRLGCGQLDATLEAARDDVTVIQRQSGVVQSALAELMRTARTDHVLESVRLPDLVSQTLEIVPDVCRQRLTVETDESLSRVGVVRVARTVLRLVLQNLIINAADAVRDAGRDSGVLRVAAEIVRDSGQEQLHLRCEDDGVGIAKDHLERVFEQGFSTKSQDSNHGIGLHWCANAIGSLGGRIWAASDGPGRGASLHVLLPLRLHTIQTTV